MTAVKRVIQYMKQYKKTVYEKFCYTYFRI